MNWLDEIEARGYTNDLTPNDVYLLLVEVRRLTAEVDAYKSDIDAGRLVRLPLVMGQEAWVIATCEDVIKQYDNDYMTGTGAVECPFEGSCDFYECRDENRQVFETAVRGYCLQDDGHAGEYAFDNLKIGLTANDVGTKVFTTEDTARAALGKEREDG